MKEKFKRMIITVIHWSIIRKLPLALGSGSVVECLPVIRSTAKSKAKLQKQNPSK
jgi:hypothetical protein